MFSPKATSMALPPSVPTPTPHRARSRLPSSLKPRVLLRYLAVLSLSLVILAYLLLFGRNHIASFTFTRTQTAAAPFLPLTPFEGCAPASLALQQPREKAAILLLVREADLDSLLPTLENFEQQFNRAFRYPYVILSTPDDPPFSPHFREEIAKAVHEGALVEYDVVPEEHWQIPEWLNATEVREGFARQAQEGVQYGGREGYHHMCRFYSGLFARQEVLRKYDWYWRLEPGVRFYCRISYDPFRFLALRNQVYGFVITIIDTANTIPSLFDVVEEYVHQAELVPSDMWPFLTQSKHGESGYNRCHFWTNFEIGDLRFFRGEAYQAFFDALDRSGGFYTERWGDAPIRTLGLALLAETDRVHFFEDLAYKHDWFMHCPAPDRPKLGCDCECPAWGEGFMNIDMDGWYSCLPEWRDVSKLDGLGRWVQRHGT